MSGRRGGGAGTGGGEGGVIGLSFLCVRVNWIVSFLSLSVMSVLILCLFVSVSDDGSVFFFWV